MSSRDTCYSVWLADTHVGVIHQRGDYTRFSFTDEYRNDPRRPVLGLIFEQDLGKTHASALRLPPWFSNLLPEGRLREWIAEDRGVSVDREMELLAQVGHDLPGAVRILPGDEPFPPPSGRDDFIHDDDGLDSDAADWHFSLAGVALKFSMLARGDRLTLPAHGEGGDWIAKLPDGRYPNVPHNEFVMMSLAARAGINVPEVRLKHRDQLDGLPDLVWPAGQQWAYAVRRFDRDDQRRPVHIEDMAQVRNVYSERKYSGNYETIASLIYRGHDVEGLREFARRLAFNILISNGDAHLKNWSLIYHDGRIPSLAPAYDLVATGPYHVAESGTEETLGLRFGGSKRFADIGLHTFAKLQERLRAYDAGLPDLVTRLVLDVRSIWPEFAARIDNTDLALDITESIDTRAKSLCRGQSTG